MLERDAHFSLMKNYFPFLNGLRCFAVLWVMIHHILIFLIFTDRNEKLSLCKRFCFAGHWGVDLFFVISGFLITGLLLPKDKSNDLPKILRFYIRRFFKIVPSYYFLLISILTLILIFFNQAYSKPILENNFLLYFSFTDNLFHVHNLFLDHLWSIAVEEHFYIIYPMIIYFIGSLNGGKFSRKWLIIVLICVLFVVNYLRYIFYNKMAEELIQNTIFRVDGIAIGCLIKLLQEWIFGLPFKKVLSYVFLVLTLSLWGILIYYGQITTWYFPTLAVFASASLIITCLMGNQFLISILELNVFQFIGRISYNLYLWHYPMIFISAYLFKQYSSLLIPGYVLLSFLMGWLMTNTLEMYFLRLRDKFFK